MQKADERARGSKQVPPDPTFENQDFGPAAPPGEQATDPRLKNQADQRAREERGNEGPEDVAGFGQGA